MHGLISLLAGALPLVAASPFIPRTESSSSGCKRGCGELASKDFFWTVEDFDFHASYIYTTPAHQTSNGYVSFNLTNPALDYPAICNAESVQLTDFFYGNQIFTCTYPAGAPDSTVTTFDFSRPSGRLDINQTWVCYDDPKYPARYNAYGSVNLTLSCTDNTYTNPNWTQGEIYSDREVKCQPDTVKLTPYLMTAVAK